MFNILNAVLTVSTDAWETAGRREPSSPGFSLTKPQGKHCLSILSLSLIIPLQGTVSTPAAMAECHGRNISPR